MAQKKVIKQAVKNALRVRLETLAMAYLKVFMTFWGRKETDGEWLNGVGSIFVLDEEYFLPFQDIIYIVENDVSSAEYDEFQSYCLLAAEFDFDTPTLEGWHSGKFRRMSPESLERLHTMKADLMKAVEEEKEAYRRV